MRKYLYIVFLILSVSSCDKWMDVVPKGQIIPSKTEDYRLLLDYYNGSGSAITTVCNLDLWMTDDFDLRADLLGSSYSPYQGRAFKFEDDFYLETEEDAGMKETYASIYVFNTVIDEVMNSEGSLADRQRLYAEAKVHRAFAYLKLVTIYSKIYNEATADKDLGVSLVLKPVLEGSLKRSSVKEVYDLILNDINEVCGYLPDKPSVESWRPSKSAAYAVLARTCLYMGDYDGALSYSDKSLELYDFLYDYNEIPKHSFYPTLLDFVQRYKNREQILLKKPTSDWLYIYPSSDLDAVYDRENDLRYVGRFDVEWDAPYKRQMFYYNQLVGCSYGVTVPEMYLTRAECNIRLGKVDDGVKDINLLRSKRITSSAYKDVTFADKDKALLFVKDERRRELAFMGVRFADLKRYNLYDNANISVVHVVDSEKFTLAPNDNKWAAPIARKYILKNPEIEQNPR